MKLRLNLAAIAAVFLLSSTPAMASEWLGDASKPLSEQWASISDQEHCSATTSTSNVPDSRISAVSDSRFADGRAIHYHMNPGDTGCFSGRSELAGGGKFGGSWPTLITPGHEGWFGFQVLYPSDYPLNSSSAADGGTMQLHGYGGNSEVPFGISAGRTCDNSEGPGTPHAGGSELGYLKAWVKATSSASKVYCLSQSIKANTVYDFLIHARFTNESNGFVEVFLNGTRVLNLAGAFGFNNNPETILRSGLYPDTSRSESPAFDLYESGWNVSSTRTEAETTAFGSTPTTEPPKEEELPKEVTDPDLLKDQAAESSVSKAITAAESALTSARTALTSAEGSLTAVKAALVAVKEER